MPRRLYADTTFDELEDEILFTIAALKADPDSRDLVSETDGWLDMVDEGRARARKARQARAEADALRVVANQRLDQACVDFSDELFLAVRKDRQSSRWKQFFSQAVSRFVRIALRRQVETVKGWLTASDDVLDRHRENLDTWSRAAGEALEQTSAQALVRGEAQQYREQLAEDLTRARDGLRDTLGARARERNLPRNWPDIYFRRQSRSRRSEPDAAPQEPIGEPSSDA